MFKKLFNYLQFRDEKSETQSKPKVVKDFDIDEFNHWFKTEFDGYDGREGAPGIFLRLDKFSPNWVKMYLDLIGQDTSYENVEKYYQLIRADWKKRL